MLTFVLYSALYHLIYFAIFIVMPHFVCLCETKKYIAWWVYTLFFVCVCVLKGLANNAEVLLVSWFVEWKVNIV